MNNLFQTKSLSVDSKRILYTPSHFARTSLLHLQEVGSLQAIQPHISMRNNLKSFLFLVVVDGSGELTYEDNTYTMQKGSCAFIDCRKPYRHSTELDLWSLQWCHFYADSMSEIYVKYKDRGGQPVFQPDNIERFTELLAKLYDLAGSTDYVRDMKINELLSTLLTFLMEESWNPDKLMPSKKRVELVSIKEYLDENYTEKISLDDLADRFYINKYYLTKIFKETYGATINNYILSKRITKAKEYLRFSSKSMEEIGAEIGIHDVNYFSRAFRKVEGITPSEYRKQW